MKNVFYLMFRNYLKTIHNVIYYRHVYILNNHNVPKAGVPTLVAANHQNALNDPLALQFSFGNKRVSIFARADVFKKKFLAKFLYSLDILPAYRMRVDGEASLVHNKVVFDEAGKRLLSGGIVAIFPEATNQDKHWLGEFSQGYLRMAFEAAEQDNFSKQIFVLPTAIHYSNYFSMQSDVLVKFGEPIDLGEYYELYKIKPRTVWREVNAKVKESINDMMLNITDLDNYEAIDYIRNSYGVHFAKVRGVDPDNLPNKLLTDKELCDKLNTLKEKHPVELVEIYSRFLKLKDFTYQEKLRDWVFDTNYRIMQLIKYALILLLLLPLYILALWPHIIIFYAQKKLTNKFEKMGGPFKMFVGGVRFVISALISIPIMYVLVFIIDLMFFDIGLALIHFLLLSILGRFAWYYRKSFIKFIGLCKFTHKIKYSMQYKYWMNERKSLFEKLNKLIFE